MSNSGFSGNRGEWCEPYVVLRLMADGKLCQADSNMNPSEIDFSEVLGVIRGDVEATALNNATIFTFSDNTGVKQEIKVSKNKLLAQANRLFSAINAIDKSKGSFELADEGKALQKVGFRRLTNPTTDGQRMIKRDLGVRLSGANIGVATLGFSVKSEIGAPPTLLNASEPTNIIYRVKGLTAAQAEKINKIEGLKKIIERCRAIKEQASSIEYEGFHSQVFHDNLDIVDSALPKMVAELLKIHYFEQILAPRDKVKKGSFRELDNLSAAVNILSNKDEYASKSRRNYCEIKIKRFLRACALGLMPSNEWNGTDDATGGYIIVLPDGRIMALYVYNTNLFEKYLYESTMFERASTTRHKFMQLYPVPDSEDYFLKLNLQIRFNR